MSATGEVGGDGGVSTMMSEALKQAEHALKAGEIPCGCVIVYDGQVIASGYNQTNKQMNATRHAEMVAFDDILLNQKYDKDIFHSCDLYVTCEPCIMCASALSIVGIRKVYFGCCNDKFGGNGSILSIHKEDIQDYYRYPVESNIMHEEAIALFQKFYIGENKRAPMAKRKRKHKMNINQA